MSDIAGVLVALAFRISTGMAGDPLAGRTFAFAPDGVITPWAATLPAGGSFLNYDVTMDGNDDLDLMVKVVVGAEFSRPAQNQLLGYMARTGSTSIRTAVYGDKTLGGTVADVRVIGWQNYGDVDWQGVTYFGAEMLLTAYT